MTAHVLTDVLGPVVVDWLGPDAHSDDAFDLLTLIADREGPYVAAAWLIGMNPHLGDTSPLHAIRNGHGVDARNAARAQINA
ncbi:hypothetical protein [Streptomyces sp. NPDC093589]|uniref:hypothetical protein n=1 Tax=Streptomyces sp. NPDC093589 TaxID=3366043 RepID=UPI0038058EBE